MPVFESRSSADNRFGLSPQDLGLPDKFREWRPQQEQGMSDVMDWDGRFVVLPMPTGTGKSAVYIGVSAMLQWRTAIITSSKGLQDQLLSDFSAPPIGLVDVRGRQNFACVNQAQFSNCETGYVGKCGSRISCECPYYEQYSTALVKDIVTTNYDYWMAVHAHGKGLGSFKLLVADEAHNAPDHICQSAAVTLSDRQVRVMLDKRWPTGNLADIQVWQRWATTILPYAVSEHARRKVVMERDIINITENEAKELSKWSTIVDSLTKLAKSSMYWAVKRTTNSGYYMEPLMASEYAEQYLWRGIGKILLTSATINLKTVEMLGIPEEQYHYRHYTSAFPVVNCRLIHVPTCRVKHDWTASDRLKWLGRIDEIISARTDRKGIIHTKSYERAMDIYNHSRYRDMMIVHEAGATAAAVEEFKGRNTPCVLVSPSAGTGYDFPDDYCRYQIISKIPFMDSRDPICQAREKYDPEYGLYVMAQDLVQMASRGNRSVTDWCENFVIDDLVSFAIFRNRKLFPTYFPRLYAKFAEVPPPRPLIRGSHTPRPQAQSQIRPQIQPRTRQALSDAIPF